MISTASKAHPPTAFEMSEFVIRIRRENTEGGKFMALPQKIPADGELLSMLGSEAYAAWNSFCSEIERLYDMERTWNGGGKKWDYEYKYRRGGKTLCALYAAPARFGLMIIFGKDERERFETVRSLLAAETRTAYDEAATYHDGKWVMFSEHLPLSDLRTMLAVKRKPNRKAER